MLTCLHFGDAFQKLEVADESQIRSWHGFCLPPEGQEVVNLVLVLVLLLGVGIISFFFH